MGNLALIGKNRGYWTVNLEDFFKELKPLGLQPARVRQLLNEIETYNKGPEIAAHFNPYGASILLKEKFTENSDFIPGKAVEGRVREILDKANAYQKRFGIDLIVLQNFDLETMFHIGTKSDYVISASGQLLVLG